MIVKPVVVKCDCCGDVNTSRGFEYGVSDARKAAKDHGYISRKVEDGEKADLCRKCKVTHDSFFCVTYQRVSGRVIKLIDKKKSAKRAK